MLGLATAAALGFATAAAAAPGLGNAVYSPYVKSGVTEVEVRGGRLVGGEEAGDSGAVVELEHGFSDRFSLAVVAEVEDEPGAQRKLDSIGLEGVAYFGQVSGVDVGGYLEYEQRIHNESGVVEAKLLLARQFGPVHGLFNLIAKQPLTGREGEGAMELGYAAQGTVDAGRGVQVGLQAFGDLGTNRSFGGRQAHFVGPVLNWEFHPAGRGNELELQAAYLLPVGAARHETDGQVRVALEWETRF
jgi:hypothetical protein